MRWIFQTKKAFIACSKQIINELRRCPTRSYNVYFANNGQVSLAVFTAVFCFTHAEHDLTKLKLYCNWSGQVVNSILVCTMWNSKKPINLAHLEN